MNQYERQHVEKIINEINQMEEREKMSDEKKAFYLYIKLGDIYAYKVNYKYANEKTKEEREAKIKIYNEGTTQEGEAICTDMNKTYIEALEMIGISAHISKVEEEDGLTHTDVCFKNKEGKYFFANLDADLMPIKTGMRIRNFGLSQEQLKHKQESYLLKMNQENKNQGFTQIPKEQLDEWLEEFGYTYNGLYTDDVLEMLANEMLDEKAIFEYFKTDRKDELAQKKFEFIMDKIGIINVHRKRKIGDVEAVNYYDKMIKKIYSFDEERLIWTCKGFIEENGEREVKNIIVIRKEKENVYYLYNSETQIYEKIDKGDLLRYPIKYYRNRNLQDFIDDVEYLESRWEEEER